MAQRPAHLKPPAYLSESPPVPLPAKMSSDAAKKQPAEGQEDRLDPTRYGDWVRNGIAVDF